MTTRTPLIDPRFFKGRMSLPKGLDLDRIEASKRAMTGYLKAVIESVISEAADSVVEKTSYYKFLKIPPRDLANFTGVPIFLKDPECSFQSVMSFGHDFNVSQRFNPAPHRQHCVLSSDGYGL